MQSPIYTSRLKLIPITRSDRESDEFKWIHVLYTNEKATFWSLGGKSTSLEESEMRLRRNIPNNNAPKASYTVAYTVHKLLESDEVTGKDKLHLLTEFIGVVNLRPIETSLPLPANLSLPAASEPETLSLEIAYLFLPTAWGKGYGTETVYSLLDAVERNPAFWAPFSKVYVRALVNPANPASQGVVKKIGMTHIGNYAWAGDAVFIAGEWRERDTIQIWGRMLSLERQS